MTIKSKRSCYGRVEIRALSGGWYGLYINGDLKEQSPDRDFIEGQYRRY